MSDGRIWRQTVWGGVGGILAVPAVAMLFTGEVRWTIGDFMTMGALLSALAWAFDRLSRRGGGNYRAGLALALFATLVPVWVQLAVGVIGDGTTQTVLFVGSRQANSVDVSVGLAAAGAEVAALLLLGPGALAAAGAVAAAFWAAGMRRATLLAAAGQVLVAIVLVTGPLHGEVPRWAIAVTILSAFLTGCWLAAAWLFGRSARRATAPQSAPR